MRIAARTIVGASLVVVLGAALTAGDAAAQRAEQRAWCAGQFGVAARQRLDACTAVIDSGRLEGKSLSSALSDRGGANMNLRNDERALADFNEAIRILRPHPPRSPKRLGISAARLRVSRQGRA